MQIGCRSTFEFTDCYSTKEELIKNLEKETFTLKALEFGITPCEPRSIEFGGKIFNPPDYK